MSAPVSNVFMRLCSSRFSWPRNSEILQQYSYVIHKTSRQQSTRELKKFYKNATVVQNDGWFEVNLDRRKLKTPFGNLFRVPNEALAMAIATEWNGQEKLVKRHNMHLTNLCNTAIDNPTHKSREDIIKGTLHFLETDTILYRLTEPPDLCTLQQKEWDPLMNWLKERYMVEIEPTTGISVPTITQNCYDTLERHLNSFSDWALVGFQYGVESLKSLIIMLALTDKLISVQKAVALARLETDFQTYKWGNVEWYHDIDIHQLQARLAASTLFIYWCSENYTIRKKASINSPQGW